MSGRSFWPDRVRQLCREGARARRLGDSPGDHAGGEGTFPYYPEEDLAGFCRRKGIPVEQSPNPNAPALKGRIDFLAPDLIRVVALRILEPGLDLHLAPARTRLERLRETVRGHRQRVTEDGQH